MIPELTDEQRQVARDVAMRSRRLRAELKSEVCSGAVSFPDALDRARADAVLSHIPVLDLLKCVPGVGPRKADLILATAKISASRRVRGLGRHQFIRLRELMS